VPAKVTKCQTHPSHTVRIAATESGSTTTNTRSNCEIQNLLMTNSMG